MIQSKRKREWGEMKCIGNLAVKPELWLFGTIILKLMLKKYDLDCVNVVQDNIMRWVVVSRDMCLLLS